MALLDDLRRDVRVLSEATDDEIQMWANFAIEDMRRCGVRDALLDEGDMDPMARGAVTMFVRANYGYDNPEADRFMASYTLTVAGLLNSRKNECDTTDYGA